ncbi:antibiotic biosynthesis monooxygenase [Modestobacter roseus]|uniref:antibiotic biosynthesis monooxygenase n=1 Tax=Modestobacter roseus TaxID=1181884 RepID=UPI0034DF651D
MFAVVYRWRLRPGSEERFRDGWERVTRAISAGCGSHGSRLHRADDGTWVAYARWPDAATRERCTFDEPEGERLMAESVVERFPELTLELVSDLLAEPPTTG